MSKKILRSCLSLCLFYVFLFAAHNGQAQGYTFTASSGTFTPLTGATTISSIQGDDVLSASVPIGFSFNYFGTAYTALKVSSNGFVSFDPSVSGSGSSNGISSGSLKLVAPLWDDLDGAVGTASYALSGTSGAQVLTIEWLNWQWNYSATGTSISMQAKFYEGTNKIEFIYRQESGVLNSPSASIGLIGNTSSAFYSLSNTSSSPSLDLNGNDLINSKPATGQVYTFTPSAVTIVAPTTAASAITASPLGSRTATFSWTNGNGNYRAVFVKQTSSTSDFFIPVDGTRYTSASGFGDSYISNGWSCVYNGTGNSVAVTNLQSTLTYRVQVVEYNGQAGLQKYNTSQVASNFTTQLAAPTDPVSTLTPYHVSSSQITVNLSTGDGLNRAIFVKAASSGTAPVVDNTTYIGNATFGTGSQIGTSGWYCVFNGSTIDALTIKSLLSNTAYRIHVVDYNGPSGSEKYYVSAVTGNPIQVSTLASVSPSLPVYQFAATSGTFTPLAGGTAVDAIEQDDALSGVIPIGFTFKMNDLQFTQLTASSNGFLSFNPYMSNLDPLNINNLKDGLGRPLVAPLWDDLSGSGGQASYLTTGVSPNRIFTFEYLSWKWSWSASAAGISFQVKLYEANSKIEYIYRPEAGALVSPSGSIGITLPNFSTGNGLPVFYSLSGPGSDATVSTSVESSIAAKPVSGQTFSFIPAKADQTITFATLSSKTSGDAPFALTATASSGLAVSYVSSNTSVATVSGSTVTIVGAGSTDITASQAGDGSFNAATNVIRTLVVKSNQVISFTAIPTKTLGDAPFALSASATSSLAVAFTTTSDKVTLSGSQVTIVKAGSVTIKADQAGNASFNPATTVERSFCINPAKPVIALSGLDSGTPVLTSSNTAGNQWLKEGTVISGATGTTFTPTGPGVYTVISKVDDCSSVSSDPQAIVITALEDVSSLITVSPNPTQKEVSIDLTSLGKEVSADVAIFDLTGRVFHSSTGKGVITVNIASYDKGNYLVRIKAGTRMVTKQIAKN